MCLVSAGCGNTTSSNKNIFLLEVMSSLGKALTVQGSSYRKETPIHSRSPSLRNDPNLGLLKVMRIFTGFRLLFIALVSRHSWEAMLSPASAFLLCSSLVRVSQWKGMSKHFFLVYLAAAGL